MKERAKGYEEDRIGNGMTSKIVGIAAQVPTFGHAGDFDVGGKTVSEREKESLAKAKIIKKNNKEQ